MSFQQGLSGLNAAAKSLDVIGNNIANASTVGFKGSQTQFADVYANSLSGAGNQAGMGVKVAQIAQQFLQGNVESSANPLDIAINGGGFFRTDASGAVQYSRNGQFSLDKGGFIVNAGGAKLTGYPADAAGNILASSPVPLKINNADLTPVATSQIDVSLNLDSRSLAPAGSTTPFAPIPFDTSVPTSYNKQSVIDVYDSLGNSHVMSTFYVKSSTPNTWNTYMAMDGNEITGLSVAAAVQNDAAAQAALTATAYAAAAGSAVTGAVASVPPTLALTAAQASAVAAAATAAGALAGATHASVDAAMAGAAVKPSGTLVFASNGVLDEVATASAMAALTPPQTLPLTIALPVFPATGANSSISATMSFTGSTQYGAATNEKTARQNGYTAGRLSNFSAGADGVILGQYSNGQSHALGQIALANFAAPTGLTSLGNNAWGETSASGAPLVGVPNSGSLGVLLASSVENSNVDLTAELVNMITAQRGYQANAQTIKTQDQVLQTLVNLR